MKTTKVILVAALMAMATLGFSQVKSTPPTLGQSLQRSALITLQSAMQNAGLRFAMFSQLTPRFLQVEKPGHKKTTRKWLNGGRYRIRCHDPPA